MDVGAVMDDLGQALGSIDGLRVHPYWADRITPPSAVVGFPDPLTFDVTMGRGADRQTFPVHLCVGKVDARTSRDRVAQYADGSGPHSVKAAVEGWASTVWDVATVKSAEFGAVTIGGTDYLSATFQIEIIGTGA